MRLGIVRPSFGSSRSSDSNSDPVARDLVVGGFTEALLRLLALDGQADTELIVRLPLDDSDSSVGVECLFLRSGIALRGPVKGFFRHYQYKTN